MRIGGWQVLGLMLVHVSVALGMAWGTVHSVRQRQESRALPEARETPLHIAPLFDIPEVVSDEQLAAALHKLRPKLNHKKPKINHIDHALRFWGLNARFDDPETLSGQEMRTLLLNHDKFAKAWGTATPPLIYARGKGLAVRTQEGNATASHVDHTLAGLAEIGTPLDFPFETSFGQGAVRQLLEESLRQFSLNQQEYEWSCLAYALYLPPTRRWISTEGQEMNFDRLARRLMRETPGRGVCFGNHRLYTLAILLRVDEQTPILEASCRGEILAYLKQTTEQLVRSQHAYGYWNGNWSGAAAAESSTANDPDSLSNRILATGHALEWWAMAPVEVHPPRESLVRAGQWLARTIGELDEKQIESNYTFLSHAGRSLALWRGRLPAEHLPEPSGANERLRGELTPDNS